jgi:hypothetical protein
LRIRLIESLLDLAEDSLLVLRKRHPSSTP